MKFSWHAYFEHALSGCFLLSLSEFPAQLQSPVERHSMLKFFYLPFLYFCWRLQKTEKYPLNGHSWPWQPLYVKNSFKVHISKEQNMDGLKASKQSLPDGYSMLLQKQPLKVFYRPATLLKKRLWHRCFLVNFVKSTRTPFLQNNSGGSFCC